MPLADTGHREPDASAIHLGEGLRRQAANITYAAYIRQCDACDSLRFGFVEWMPGSFNVQSAIRKKGPERET